MSDAMRGLILGSRGGPLSFKGFPSCQESDMCQPLHQSVLVAAAVTEPARVWQACLKRRR